VRFSLLALGLVVVASCGRFGFEGSEAGLDAAQTGDAAVVPDAAGSDAAALGIATVAGAVVISPPPSVLAGDLERDDAATLFIERSLVTLAADVDVSFRTPGTYTDMFGSVDPTPIPAGTRVLSLLLHSDKVGSDATLVTYDIGLTFNYSVLGIMTGNSTLDGSDPELGAEPTTYPVGGRSADDAEDTIAIADDFLSMKLNLQTNTGIDQVRVLLAVP